MSAFRLALLALVVAFTANAIRDIQDAMVSPIGLQDDAYYYLMIARNLAATGHATFDGVNPTNGYHPLWLWIEAAALRLTHVEGTSQVVLVTVLEYAILAASLLAVAIATRRRIELGAALLFGAALLLYPPHLRIFAAGMESTLVLPLGAAFLFELWDGRPRWAGLFAVLLVLARLDTAIYVVVPAVALSVRRPRELVWVLGPAALALGTYTLANQIAYGHPLPISGMSKSCFPYPHVQLAQISSALDDPRWWRALNQLTGLVPVVLGPLLVRGRGALGQQGARVVRWLAVLGATQVASFVLFQRWVKPLEQWYLAPLVAIGAAIVAATVVDRVGARWALRATAVVALAVAVLVGAGFGDRAPESQKQGVIDFLDTLPKGMVFASTDTGILAFGSDRPGVNLDGLVNSFAYQDAIHEGRVGTFLRQEDVHVLVVRIWETAPAFDEPMYRSRVDPDVWAGQYASYKFWVHSYLWDADSEPLTISHRREMWRGPAMMDQGVRSRFVAFIL